MLWIARQSASRTPYALQIARPIGIRDVNGRARTIGVRDVIGAVDDGTFGNRDRISAVNEGRSGSETSKVF